MERYDFVVLGAGSAGYWAAKTAGKAGARVLLADPGPLGGLCILRGCMPSKALLRSGEVAHLIRRAGRLGIRVGEPVIDFEQVMARKRHWVNDFAGYRIEGIEKQDGFEFVGEAARFVGPHELALGDRRVAFDKALISTGSVVAWPPVPGLREAGAITSDEALSLDRVPASMLVVGGGVIALELGQFYARMGAQVKLVLRGDRVLTGEDPEVSAALEAAFAEEGIEILREVAIHRARKGDAGIELDISRQGQAERLVAESVLVATGRQPRLEGLGLVHLGLSESLRQLPVDEFQRIQGAEHVYAAGDAAGQHQLVHVAIQEGIVAAKHASGQPCEPVRRDTTAAAIFCEPGVGRVGLNRQEAAAQGRRVVSGSYPFNDQGKALVADLTHGHVEVLADADTGVIVGATVVGAEAGDLIHEMILAVHMKMTLEAFLEVPHLHPTLAEAWLDAAEEALDALREGAVV